ncbi:MAG: NADH-quinone oxidoreductase subunit H [Candidatus Cloacimonetes bacterium]|jgi:NADH-quinone oxidoreductase subunit H|nr:NADH-quinone oxidoreductase subunit H [Candidatus Cloacimonadota bacterium]MBT7469138.1 NADH-quinone oxidoreductase subunit H [Candidatus Cloacimonadota bacterium]
MTIATVLYALISLLIILAWGLLMNGIVRRVVAKVHGRIGPPLWQPFVDIIKNNAKRTAISHGIMFYLGPVFRIAGGIGTFLFIPIIFGSTFFANFSFAGDVLLVMYFIFFGQLGMALGAGEGGHPHSAIGVGRGLAQMTAFEVPFALSIISIAMQYHTLNITEIVAAQQAGIFSWTIFTNPFATIAALIALLGMNMHSPFDIVLAPQEIPIGPPTEFHSFFLGTLQTNRAIFNMAKLVLFMNLFFGGATNFPILMIKTFLIYMISVVVGVSYPRFRTEQSIRFFLGVPTLIGIISVVIFMVK